MMYIYFQLIIRKGINTYLMALIDCRRAGTESIIRTAENLIVKIITAHQLLRIIIATQAMIF